MILDFKFCKERSFPIFIGKNMLMQLNRCYRCGCFFASQGEVCPRCQPKDLNEQTNLSNYLPENGLPGSVEELATQTNISTRNLNRFLGKEQFADYQFPVQQ